MISPLIMGLVVFTFVFLIGPVFKLTDKLLNSSVPGSLVTELILLLLPGVLSFTIPMAVLVAILLGVGRLAADREILAIRTTGVNLLHVCTPILVLSAVLAAAMMFANQRLIPYLNQKSTDVKMQLEFYVLSAIPAGFPFDLPSSGKGGDTTFFYDHKDPASGAMTDVMMRTEQDLAAGPAAAPDKNGSKAKVTSGTKTAAVAQHKTAAVSPAKGSAKVKTAGNAAKQAKDNALSAKDLNRQKAQIRQEKEKRDLQIAEYQKRNESLVVARSARILPDISERVLKFELTSGSIHFTNPNEPTSYDVIKFDTMVKGYVPVFARTEDGYYVKKTDEMSNSELLQSRREAGKVKGARFMVEFFQRYSIPLACIAFALIAIPLAVYVRPTGKAIAFAMSFILILLYYGLQQYGVALGKSGSSIGTAAIFFPNVLLMSAGSVLLYRMVMK